MKYYVVLFLVGFSFMSVIHAEGAGLQVNYNNIKIHITYNDNVEDKITGVEYIRRPSDALFDVIYLLQKNSSSIANLNKDIEVNIDNYGGNISIYQEVKPTSVLLRTNNFKHLDNKMLLSAICAGLSIRNCTVKDNTTVDIYLSDSYVSGSETDLIDFGCFPCSNNKTITLTDRYTPMRANAYPPKFKKVTVNRHTIYHYFNNLRN
ncbi:MAG: hypothetical protein GY820_43650 [Gammaproteobacteria bacterium]|nr:hypothetical protein [Gammaproteobacteria bacterium]